MRISIHEYLANSSNDFEQVIDFLLILSGSVVRYNFEDPFDKETPSINEFMDQWLNT